MIESLDLGIIVSWSGVGFILPKTKAKIRMPAYIFEVGYAQSAEYGF
jgi:hypothetical protein